MGRSKVMRLVQRARHIIWFARISFISKYESRRREERIMCIEFRIVAYIMAGIFIFGVVGIIVIVVGRILGVIQ